MDGPTKVRQSATESAGVGSDIESAMLEGNEILVVLSSRLFGWTMFVFASVLPWKLDRKSGTANRLKLTLSLHR